MDFNIDLFIYALETNHNNNLWELWKMQYGHLVKMSKEEFISFQKYTNKPETKIDKKLSYEEIEKEMAQVEKAFEERR